MVFSHVCFSRGQREGKKTHPSLNCVPATGMPAANNFQMEIFGS
jgi:hypothetical protein